MQPRYTIRITPADVGRRVSIRSRTLAPQGEPSMTDAVGTLCSWRDGVLEVERRNGTIARIAEVDLLAGKTIPDPRARQH
ncbi:MAG TPA: hypothetical protein VML96_08135 [Egibacteraceae bacterium]|nr:hypothetical protein [Egibacteraceae bacterium]